LIWRKCQILLGVSAGLVVDVGLRAARPDAATDRLLLGERAMPLLHAPLQRRERAALERKACVRLLHRRNVVDQVVHRRDRGRVARKEARDVLPERRRDREALAQLGVRDLECGRLVIPMRAGDGVPERLLRRGDLGRRGEEMVGFEFRQIGMRGALVQRAALGCDQIPANEVGLRARVAPLGGALRKRAGVVDEVVGNAVDPDFSQVRRRRIARERKIHEVEKAALRRARLQPAAPFIGRAQREFAIPLDLAAPVELEIVVAGRDGRSRAKPRMRLQPRADRALGALLLGFPQFGLPSHG
jgi:hypothetical protein